jgi:hypothetical protein
MEPVDLSIRGLEKMAFIIVLAIGLAIAAYEIYFHLRLLLLFKPERRTDHIGQRITKLFKFVFGQRRLLDQIAMGSAHFMIFWGFIIISFGTLSFFGNGFSTGFRLPLIGTIFNGPFLILLDLFSVLVLIASACHAAGRPPLF